ncbi:hypothetical protein EJ04DRAFT_610507 [Polyplosphaeria fusca]|uniref:Uncharacterized protein n=1 Tax=Polyplosphaeria fusca TaxID=682080 RepID=A0A9P4QUV9_9PLEO|nr:hypothetical protein EJ04DRAFT_610507 [Polyplosphaeria fusca]
MKLLPDTDQFSRSSIPVCNAPPAINTENYLGTIERWLQQCTKNHKLCNIETDGGYFMIFLQG